MLVGSGGVVALVVGAWSVLWAIRGVPGLGWRTWYPVVVAFVAAIWGFAMLTAQSEIGLGILQWARYAADDRPGVVVETLSVTWRPLYAAGIAIVAFGIAIVASRRPISPLDERTPHWIERVAVVAMVGFAVLDTVVWVALQRAFEAATGSRELWLASGPRIQGLTFVGATASFLLLGLAGVVGAVRQLRRR